LLQLPLACVLVSVSANPGYAPYLYHGPPAPLAHDGRVIDTPEVAHAKAAHLAAHAAEAAKASPSGYDYYDGQYASFSAGEAPKLYHGPPAPLAHDGRVIDTPEVAHAKAAHLAAHAEQLSKVARFSYPEPYAQNEMCQAIVLVIVNVAYSAPQWYGGHGHAAPAPLGPDGRVVDTPEVAQLKASHLAALAEANARAPKAGGPYGGAPYGGAPYGGAPYGGPAAGAYGGPGAYGSHYRF
ncbi:cuticle protein 18.7-like, partial [Ceratina calcarata]|uniref:Cuticle protein 18.7-like n=1 Tax=Ceratina calcarata TaxID=156304 RepID=A0AAJ7N6P3_9HYME